MTMKKLNLLPRHALIKTGDVDHAHWNYDEGPLGWIQRRRFHLILNLISARQFNRKLEVGYGSGVFSPVLARYADEYYGIDIHDYHEKVTDILREHQVEAKLFSASAEKLPFESNFFNAVVAVSTMEFIPDLNEACREISRTMRHDGSFFLVTPMESPIADMGLRLLTGIRAKDDYEHGRKRVIPTLREHFHVRKHLTFPKTPVSQFCIYHAFELGKKP